MALAERTGEWQQEEEGRDDRGDPDDEHRLGALGHEREDREVADEEPVRTGIGDDDRRVRRRAELGWPDDEREHGDDAEDDRSRGGVAPCGVREVRQSASDERLVVLHVRTVDRLIGARRLGDAALHDEVHVEEDEQCDRAGDDEDMRREHATHRRAADRVAAHDEPRERVADERRPRRLLGADHE